MQCKSQCQRGCNVISNWLTWDDVQEGPAEDIYFEATPTTRAEEILHTKNVDKRLVFGIPG